MRYITLALLMKGITLASDGVVLINSSKYVIYEFAVTEEDIGIPLKLCVGRDDNYGATASLDIRYKIGDGNWNAVSSISYNSQKRVWLTDAFTVGSNGTLKVKLTYTGSSGKLAIKWVVLVRQGGLDPLDSDTDKDGLMDGDEKWSWATVKL